MKPPYRQNRRHLVAAILVAGLCAGCGKQAPAPAAATLPATVNTAIQPAPATTLAPGFAKLKGRWVRPDGGYILEVRNVEAGGKMEASYHNPNLINVAKAEASQEGTVTKVFVELRDVNYPGCTYNLRYEAQSDQLSGIYYQAALQQQYEVIFERIP